MSNRAIVVDRYPDTVMLDSMAFTSDADLAALHESLPVLLRIATDLDTKRRRSRPSLLQNGSVQRGSPFPN